MIHEKTFVRLNALCLSSKFTKVHLILQFTKKTAVCVVKLKARREDVEVHLLLQETAGAFSLTKRKEVI